MPLQKQVVSWPLTGGIDTKKSPLALDPGSHLILQNVRQERENEWRLRGGFGSSGADALPGALPPLKPVSLPGGASWGMAKETTSAGVVSPMVYTPSSSAGSRWNRLQTADSSQLTPGVWNRRSVGTSMTSIMLTDYCQGANFALSAWSVGSGVTMASVTSVADGDQLSDPIFPGGQVSSNGTRPRCFVGPSGRLCLVYFNTSTGQPIIAQWDGSTGQSLGQTVIGIVGVIGVTSFFDAIFYAGGSTITIVVQDGGGLVRFVEYNPLTLAIGTNVLLAGCAPTAYLGLLAEPGGSGMRYVAWSSATPTTHVTRVNAAGAIQTDETVGAVTALALAGIAYQAGAGWMVAYTTGTATGINVVKQRSGVISAPVAITPAGHPYDIASHPWTDSAITDAFRFLIAVNSGLPDPQRTYLEIAIPFDTGATVSNLFPEPQARLCPLVASPSVNFGLGHLPRPSRIAAGDYVMGLGRLAQFGIQASGEAAQYAIDRWRVTYQSAGAVLNQGAGVTTPTAAYVPAGSLLSSATGSTVVAHGLSTLPFQPALTPGVGGALTAGQAYGYVIVVKTLDDNGAPWRSTQSIPAMASAAAMAGNNRISVAVKVGVTELARRIITVEIYRTQGNGSTYTLVNSRTGAASSLASFTFNDTQSDVSIQGTTALPGEALATITPAFSHVALFNGRLWGTERDFPNLWFSKPLIPGFQPEFPFGFSVPIADAFGDATGLAAMDDKLVVFKKNRRYIVTGDGPDNTGAGRLPTVTGLDSDLGAIVGSPLVSTMSEVFYVSQRGIQRMDRSLQDTFVGAPVDLYLNQPMIRTPATVVGAVFSTKKNEVRFAIAGGTDSPFEQLVFDRLRGLWYHDVSDPAGSAVSATMMGVPNSVLWAAGADPVQIVFLANGSMLTEAPDVRGSSFNDGGFFYLGRIRSASIVPVGNEGWLRVYRVNAKGRQTVDVSAVSLSPTLRIIYDDNDALFEDFVPIAPIAANAGPVELTWRGSARPRRQKCSSFSLQLTIPNIDSETAATFRLDAWACEVGIKSGMQRLGSAERWT